MTATHKGPPPKLDTVPVGATGIAHLAHNMAQHPHAAADGNMSAAAMAAAAVQQAAADQQVRGLLPPLSLSL